MTTRTNGRRALALLAALTAGLLAWAWRTVPVGTIYSNGSSL